MKKQSTGFPQQRLLAALALLALARAFVPDGLCLQSERVQACVHNTFRAIVAPPTQCTYTISPTNQSFPASGGTGSVGVTAGAGCTWTVASNASWITVTAGASGSGNGTVNYSVAANQGNNSRRATLTVAGNTFTVMQAGAFGSCAVQPISPGQSLNGDLSASDCYSLQRSGSFPYADRYSFSGSAGQQVAILLESADVNTYLYLIGPNGAVVAQNDGAGNNSRIPPNTGFFTLPLSGGYLIEATSASTGDTGNYTLSLNTGAAGCTYSVAPSSQSFAQAGGSGTVNVTAANGCTWQAGSGANWIAITAGNSGSGNGTVTYSVAANTTYVARTGLLTIAGQTFTVSQTGCSYLLSPTGEAFEPVGGSGSIVVTASAGNCTWAVGNGVSWITINSGGTGTGNGTVSYTVAPNTGAASRRRTLTIADQNFPVAQAGVGGTCVVTPISPGQPLSGTLAPSDCASPLRSTSSTYYADRYSFTGSAGQKVAISLESADVNTYLYLIAPDGVVIAENNGTGNNSRIPASTGFFSLPASGPYLIEATSGSAGDTGSYTLSLTVDAPACSYAIAPISQSFGISGGSGSVSVTVASGCGWTAASNASWITITAGSSGSGNGTVNYSVGANPGTSQRTGTMTIAGQTFTVMQSGVALNPAPAISGITPASVMAGGAAFLLTVNGASFVSGAAVRLNGNDRQTTFISATQLTAQIPAADIATAGSAQVTVFNPTPGGGTSAATTLTITPAVSGFTVSGKVTYSDQGRPVPGVIVTASAPNLPTVASPPSGSDGQYAVTGLAGGNYIVTPAKSGAVNGITAFDAARLLKHLADSDPLGGLQRKAADVDGNGVVDAQDARRIANFVVGNTAESGQAGKWVFEPDRKLLPVNGDLPNQDFQTALVGDITGNWSPGTSPAITAVTPVTLSLKNTATGGEVNLPGVTVSGAGFAPGLTLVVTFPDGGEMRLGEGRILQLQQDSFAALVALDASGLWALRVINADGRSSGVFVVRIE